MPVAMPKVVKVARPRTSAAVVVRVTEAVRAKARAMTALIKVWVVAGAEDSAAVVVVAVVDGDDKDEENVWDRCKQYRI